VSRRAQKIQDNGDDTRHESPAAERDASLLTDAVKNPGTLEIPDEPPRVGSGIVTEIPEESLDGAADATGKSLDRDPAIMTVELSRPGPFSWIRLFPELTHHTVMLPFRAKRDDVPDYHWVTPELRSAFKGRLKNVDVYMCFDVLPPGEPFLWIVPQSERSPYAVAIARALARGDQCIRNNVFQFVYSEEDGRKVHLGERPYEPDDAAVLLPSRPVKVLLPEALGSKIIRTTDHAIYRAVARGNRVS
jgi:hypothetical protein